MTPRGAYLIMLSAVCAIALGIGFVAARRERRARRRHLLDMISNLLEDREK